MKTLKRASDQTPNEVLSSSPASKGARNCLSRVVGSSSVASDRDGELRSTRHRLASRSARRTRAEVVFVKKCKKSEWHLALDQRSAARQVPSLRAAAPAAMARSARRAVAETSALSQVVAIASGSRQASGRRACVRALLDVLMEKKYCTCLHQGQRPRARS